jgi:hypothetical protein
VPIGSSSRLSEATGRKTLITADTITGMAFPGPTPMIITELRPRAVSDCERLIRFGRDAAS